MDRYLVGSGALPLIVEEVYQVLNHLPPRDLEPDARFTKPGAGTRLYIGKLPRVIQGELEELGVALRTSETEMAVPPAVLTVVLSVVSRFAAKAMDEHELRRTGIFTDRRYLARQALGGLPTGPQTLGWKVQLGQRLPVPVDGTDPERVSAFRNRYKDERQHLAVAITKLASSLSPGGEVAMQALVADVLTAERDVLAAARSRGVGMVKRGLSLIAAGGLATAATAVSAGEAELAAMMNLLSAAGVSAAMLPIRSTGSGADFGYLAQVHKSFEVASSDAE